MKLKVEGVDNLTQMFQGKQKSIENKITKALAKSGMIVAADAKAKAPVKTGQLRDSINVKISGKSAEIGTNVEYAIYQEFGTRYIKAHPYLIPALKENTDRIQETFKEILK